MRFSILFLAFAVALFNAENDDFGGSDDQSGNPEDVLEESGASPGKNHTLPSLDDTEVVVENENGSGKPDMLENSGAAPAVDIVDTATGAPEQSTLPPKEPAQLVVETENPMEPIGSTEPFDISNMETGAPEASTAEPYMPKPKPKPNKGGNESLTDSSDSPLFTLDVEIVTDYPENPSGVPVESIAPIHWRTTTTSKKDFTISQKMDENSPGYKQLLHMLEDLDVRRKETTTGSNQTDFYMSRASVAMDTIDNSFTNPALANITLAQDYIKKLLANASVTVRQGYAQIVSLTSTPSFYYIPKKQRYLMVNQIITDMGTSGQQEMMSLNKQAKTFCRNANVDTPPYSLGNIVGNKLANGAILTK